MSTTAQTLQVTHHYRASIERVFDAWLNPATLGRWLFATPTGEMVRIEVDARVGGRFVVVERRDGVDVEHTGEYLTIDRPHRLVFTFGVPAYGPHVSTISIDLVALPDNQGCILTLTHEDLLPDFKAQIEQGWTTMLVNLDAALSAAA